MSDKDIKDYIERLSQKARADDGISFDEALEFIDTDIDDVSPLFSVADNITRGTRGRHVDLCSLVNAKSGSCSEDCKFCAQSNHYPTKTPTYRLISTDEILRNAREVYKNKAHRFCIVTSGCSITKSDLEKVCEAVSLIRKELPQIKIDASLGELDEAMAQKLRDSGLQRYNHNVETAKSYFPEIVSTHTYEDRLKTIKAVKKVGIELCCGGIFGLGETQRQRVEFAFELKNIDPDCIPLNFLYPIPGTPLDKSAPLNPIDIFKIIALFRMVNPSKQIRVCGGRQKNLGELQPLIFKTGADAIILGNYLTTKGNPPHQDLEMIAQLGLDV